MVLMYIISIFNNNFYHIQIINDFNIISISYSKINCLKILNLNLNQSLNPLLYNDYYYLKFLSIHENNIFFLIQGFLIQIQFSVTHLMILNHSFIIKKLNFLIKICLI